MIDSRDCRSNVWEKQGGVEMDVSRAHWVLPFAAVYCYDQSGNYRPPDPLVTAASTDRVSVYKAICVFALAWRHPWLASCGSFAKLKRHLMIFPNVCISDANGNTSAHDTLVGQHPIFLVSDGRLFAGSWMRCTVRTRRF